MKYKKLTAIPLLFFAATSSAFVVYSGSSGHGILSFFDLKKKLTASLDFPLYRNESYSVPENLKNSSEEEKKNFEQEAFLNDAWAVVEAQFKLAFKNKGLPKRVFHAKSHGCLTGTLKILPPQQRNSSTAHGMFQTEAEYPVIARFSNGVGWAQHDLLPDVRGIGLKIFGVPNSNTGEAQTVDLTMTNSTNPFGRDHAQFVEFMNANVKGNLALVKFALSQRKRDPRELSYLKHFVKSVFPVASLVTTQFWSGHAYLMSPKRAMKLSLIPVSTNQDLEDEMDRSILTALNLASKEPLTTLWNGIEELIQDLRIPKNYLKTDLLKKAKAGQIQYQLAVQLEQNPEQTPIENALIPWQTPFHAVGTLTFDEQNFTHAQREAACEQFRFSPAHYHPEHRPLGNMARGRLFGYEASQIGRNSSAQEPSADTPEIWKNGDY